MPSAPRPRNWMTERGATQTTPLRTSTAQLSTSSAQRSKVQSLRRSKRAWCGFLLRCCSSNQRSDGIVEFDIRLIINVLSQSYIYGTRDAMPPWSASIQFGGVRAGRVPDGGRDRAILSSSSSHLTRPPRQRDNAAQDARGPAMVAASARRNRYRLRGDLFAHLR
jgi:hypothetical protein